MSKATNFFLLKGRLLSMTVVGISKIRYRQYSSPYHQGALHLLVVVTADGVACKLERSGLSPCFKYVEIVSNKRPEDYAAILERYNIPPERFLMVGNSLRSDVLPVVAIGGQAIHIPYETTWVHELVNPDEAAANHYHELESIQLLPAWLKEFGN